MCDKSIEFHIYCTFKINKYDEWFNNDIPISICTSIFIKFQPLWEQKWITLSRNTSSSDNANQPLNIKHDCRSFVDGVISSSLNSQFRFARQPVIGWGHFWRGWVFLKTSYFLSSGWLISMTCWRTFWAAF